MYSCFVLCIGCFVSFSVLFVCICVLYYCHRVATQLQLNIPFHINYNHVEHQLLTYYKQFRMLLKFYLRYLKCLSFRKRLTSACHFFMVT